MVNPDMCTCGHNKAMHEHDREGSDCRDCGPTACPQFNPAPEPTQRYVGRHRPSTQR